MKKFICLSIMSLSVLSTIAYANQIKTGTFTIEIFPFVASLGDNAERIELSLANKAAEICGSLENVSELVNVKLNMQTTQAYSVNSKGTAGASNHDAILMFAYPRVTGTAKAICKTVSP